MKKMSRVVVVMVAAMVLLALSIPAFASPADDRIESSVKETYVFKTFLKDDDVKVKSNDGVVTLTGTVADEYHKSLANETAVNISGVKSVDNKLEVKGEQPAERSDAWLTAKVKTTLLFHRNVSAMTEVSTKDGVVTLKGEADNKAEKDLAAEYANDIDGVKSVNNMMTVGKSPKKKQTTMAKIDDASITAQVKTSLLYHRSTSGLKTSITTKNGVVTLTGKARNAAEKDLAAKYANNVNGVKSVNNRMTIE